MIDLTEVTTSARETRLGRAATALGNSAISNPDDAPTQHMVYRLEQGMPAGGFGILLAKKFVDELVTMSLGTKC